MSTQTPSPEPTVESEINKLLATMSGLNQTHEDYAKLVDQLTKLYKLKELDTNLALKYGDQKIKRDEVEANISLKEKEAETSNRLKTLDAELKEKDVETYGKLKLETLAPIAGSLGGILLILGFERAHVVTSKALGFVMKSR